MNTTNRVMATAAALAVTLAAGDAAAACDPLAMQSIPGTREAHFVDRDGSGGASLGDTRNGEIALQSGGKPLGKEYWLATVRAVDAEGKPTDYDEVQVFVFDDGALFTATSLALSTSFETTGTIIVPTGSERQVVGGTGAYAGARGMLKTTVDGVDFTFRFDVTCE